MSWPAALVLGLGASLGLSLTHAVAQTRARAEPAPAESAPAESAPDAPPATAADAEPSSGSPTPTADVVQAAPAAIPEDERVIDRVLPCGLRVLVAHDDSLPVASVVLSLERGSEDDPPDQAGLHHALAYHLLQGNRDMPPGGITSLVQDGGGIASIATGPAQIRFESLVPVSLLEDVIAAEASRFRAPTVTPTLWKDTLATARRDVPRRTSAPAQAIAAAHGAAGLAFNGRAVPETLATLEPAAVEKLLASIARYEFATLVVVAPHPIEQTMQMVDAATADLPATPRLAQPRLARRTAPHVELDTSKGRAFVWAIEGSPRGRLWASAWCEAINRQRRAKDEPKATRLRCVFDDDPRRPVLTLRARTPEDPATLVERRVTALGQRGGKRLIRAQLNRLRDDLDARRSRPLDLARMLSATPEGTPGEYGVRDVIGQTALDADPLSAQDILRLDAAVRVLGPGGTTVPMPKPSEKKRPPPEAGSTPAPEAPQDDSTNEQGATR